MPIGTLGTPKPTVPILVQAITLRKTHQAGNLESTWFQAGKKPAQRDPLFLVLFYGAQEQVREVRVQQHPLSTLWWVVEVLIHQVGMMRG